MSNQEQPIYSTRDIALAATLITLHFKLVSIDYQFEGTKSSPIAYFGFPNTEAIQEAVFNYFQPKGLMVEPREFMGNMRALKAQITNAFRSPKTEFGR